MRVLVTWGSKRGGTEGIGRMLGEALAERGFVVRGVSVDEIEDPQGFDAVIIGGALYANRWPANVRGFVKHNLKALRQIPVWFFSSGPLDDSADRADIPATPQVSALAESVGANGHVTFGGRLEPDAKGFPARAMAKTKSGDFRSSDRIRAWADELAAKLPEAKPQRPIDHPGHALPRLVFHGLVGWALCGATMGALLAITSITTALVVHAVSAPVFFAATAWHYFRARGARDPLPTAVTWTAMVMLLDLVVVAGAIVQSLDMFKSLIGTWLPFALIFFSTWVTGGLMSTLPWPKAADGERAAAKT